MLAVLAPEKESLTTLAEGTKPECPEEELFLNVAGDFEKKMRGLTLAFSHKLEETRNPEETIVSRSGTRSEAIKAFVAEKRDGHSAETVRFLEAELYFRMFLLRLIDHNALAVVRENTRKSICELHERTSTMRKLVEAVTSGPDGIGLLIFQELESLCPQSYCYASALESVKAGMMSEVAFAKGVLSMPEELILLESTPFEDATGVDFKVKAGGHEILVEVKTWGGISNPMIISHTKGKCAIDGIPGDATLDAQTWQVPTGIISRARKGALCMSVRLPSNFDYQDELDKQALCGTIGNSVRYLLSEGEKK